MADFVTGLITAMQPDALWSGAVALAPLFGGIIIFSLAKGFIDAYVAGAGKGKPKI